MDEQLRRSETEEPFEVLAQEKIIPGIVLQVGGCVLGSRGKTDFAGQEQQPDGKQAQAADQPEQKRIEEIKLHFEDESPEDTVKVLGSLEEGQEEQSVVADFVDPPPGPDSRRAAAPGRRSLSC